jgi:hypothetical protein
MTGIPQFNFPAFAQAADALRAEGHVVISPHETDDPETQAKAWKSETGMDDIWTTETYGQVLGRDIETVIDKVDGVVVLPGWYESSGACTEIFVALRAGHPVFRYEDDGTLTKISRQAAAQALYEKSLGAPGRMSSKRVEVPTGFDHHQVEEYELVSDQGEVRTVSATGGEKGVKPQRMDLLPWAELAKVAELYAAGARKYADHNWRKGYAWSNSYASLIRHAALFWEGEDFDDETECHHLTSVVFHALALLYFAEHFPQFDDRPPKP